MIRWIACLLSVAILFAPGAFAQSSGQSSGQSARVLSGEHADFTRLVIELPGDGDWILGRTMTGYGFASGSVMQPVYDLSKVWDRIPRSRLQSLRVDPDSGALLISLACPCHVFPFEYQKGMVVLDIRGGPAPPASAFEAAFSLPSATLAPISRPELAVISAYDWLDPLLPVAGAARTGNLPLQPSSGDPALQKLRDELLLQISRGAADGVVDMKLPGKATLTAINSGAALEGARISLGELPGVAILEGSDELEDRQTDKAECLPDKDLSVADWGNDRPPLDLLAEARGGLYGEFDAADPAAVLRAIKLHIYLGFGAEALQYAALLPDPEADRDLAPLLSMARLIDGESDPATPFASMLGCDGSAALWAALAHARLPPTTEVNTDAIVRSFQTLPPHLRRALGMALVDRLLERDADAARMIRDAMERTPEMPKGTVALMDAKADLQAGLSDAALVHAEAALAGGGSTPDGLIALVDAHFRSSLPLSADVAEALGSLFREADPGRNGQELHRALVLSLALSGQVDEAFGLVDPAAPESADLWSVLADRAEDGAFLVHAVLPSDAPVPPVSEKVALALATRLSALGFAEAALAWLGPVGPEDPALRREIAATAELLRGDARRVLTLLSGLEGPEITRMRTEAQTQLGALDAARQSLEADGQADKAFRLATWQEDWPTLQTGGADPWATAAAFATVPPPMAPGTLARGMELLADSTAARTAITALLTGVPAPAP
ncbi:MAG: hypothetical protein NTW20_05240 [Rhodobacterales bacterium]|nr:hypothetical protein [Rhodobacterales bacterium]